jgi:hypothetical protein
LRSAETSGLSMMSSSILPIIASHSRLVFIRHSRIWARFYRSTFLVPAMHYWDQNFASRPDVRQACCRRAGNITLYLPRLTSDPSDPASVAPSLSAAVVAHLDFHTFNTVLCILWVERRFVAELLFMNNYARGTPDICRSQQ